MPSRFGNMTDLNPNSSIFPSAVTGNSSLGGIGRRKQYIFTPAGLDIKLPLSLLIAVGAAIGFVGNLCVLRFTNKEEKKPVRARSSKLNFFIRSLAMSDILGSLVGAPLFLIQINFDVFQLKWPCTICRVFQTLFLVITIYNLVVVALERYICTCRPTSRPLSLTTVKKAVKGAWVLGFLITLVSSYTFDGVRVDLNKTHYTVTCVYDYNNDLRRVVSITVVLLIYMLPTIVLVFTCASVIRVVCKRTPIVAQQPTTSEVLRKWRIKQKKATTQLMVIIIAFITPYFLLLGYVLFNSIFTPSVEFKTHYAIRYTSASIAYLNCSVNFFIHLVQLNGFRQTLKGYVVCCEKCQTDLIERPIGLGRIRARDHKAIRPIKADHCKKRRASMSDSRDIKRSHRIQERRHSL